MVSKSSHSNLILGNLCHIHCYCCRCFFFLLCAIWKINKTITKRITEKGHFLMSRDFLHEFVHVCRGILTRAWFVRNYLYWYSARVIFIFFFDIEYILITFLSQREVSNNFFYNWALITVMYRRHQMLILVYWSDLNLARFWYLIHF